MQKHFNKRAGYTFFQNIAFAKISLLLILITVLTLVSSVNVFAQCDPFLDPFCTEPIPLDGGIVALLVAGAAYGFKKIKDSTDSTNH